MASARRAQEPLWTRLFRGFTKKVVGESQITLMDDDDDDDDADDDDDDYCYSCWQ